MNIALFPKDSAVPARLINHGIVKALKMSNDCGLVQPRSVVGFFLGAGNGASRSRVTPAGISIRKAGVATFTAFGRPV
jgi:hypothetical protein